MIQDLGNRMETQIEKKQVMFNKHVEEIKKQQIVTNNTIVEKNTLEGINSKVTEAENGEDSEDRMVEITTMKQNKNEKRNEDSPRDQWDSIKHTNI